MPRSRSRAGWIPGALVAGALVLVACGGDADRSPDLATAPPADAPSADAPPADAPPAEATTSTAPVLPTKETPAPGAVAANGVTGPPSWLGTRPLPIGPSGYGEIQPTPPELTDRRLTTVDLLPVPPDGAFASSVGPVPDAVAQRSTWDAACPVGLGDLRYLTVSFWGFDGRPHTGELLVHADAADAVVEIFRGLYGARFPIEEMRVTRADELGAAPTGDGNNTGAFVCRPSRGESSWSEHAYGRAVDINPFHNPYIKGEVVLPELASAYRDRSEERPGMILAGGVATSAFADIGWGWGGDWRSSRDYMHFSANGR